MKRCVLLTIVAAVCLAQHPRDLVRQAYRAWREADPNLERESATGGPAVAQRADRLAAEAAKYSAARKALLDGIAQDQGQLVASLENASLSKASSAVATEVDTQFLTAETARVTRTIGAFANDPDRGIQQLRRALERERTALSALSTAVLERQKSVAAAQTSTEAAEVARAKALDRMRSMLAAAKEVADQSAEAAAWVEYYRKIGEASQGAAIPITVVQPGAPPATLNNPAPAPPTITPVPLARYVGSWTFPPTNGLFHGSQPELIDVVVSEENGQAKGTLVGRFKLPAGSKGDPVLRFDFSGPFQPTRNQTFPLVTSDGTKGTIELIPGAAFNLLEVNFQTEAKSGKIRQADIVLVKK